PGTNATMLLREDVVPVCSPRLGGYRQGLEPADLAELPLLQQSTRPEGWRQWFDAFGVDAPGALRGPRYELFSMTVAAAVHGGGVALAPIILIQEELNRGDLVVACDRQLPGNRHYCLVAPAHGQERPALTVFRRWLQRQVRDCGEEVGLMG